MKKSKRQEILEKCERYELKECTDQYGLVPVLSTLSEAWNVEKTTEWCSNLKLKKSKKERIKVIATSFYRAHDGGTERVNAELMDMWVQMGYQVVLFTEQPENELDFPYPSSVKRVVIPAYKDLAARLAAIKKTCEEESVDVFVNHNWNNPAFIWECVMLRSMGALFVQYCHGHFAWSIAQGRDGLFQPRSFQICDMVVAVSETNARFYQLCGCNAFFVHNPIPKDLMMVQPTKLDSKSVLMSGRLSWEKYPLESLKIFKIAHDRLPDIELDIVGDGPLKAQMHEYVVTNNLQEAVHFHGNQSAEEIKSFYDKCAAILLTSKMEAFSMVVLEAKAWGIPVVMYDLPYLTLLQERRGILTAEFEEYEKMANYLISILDNQVYRQKLGTEARESFQNLLKYNLKAKWEDIFSLMLKTRNTEIKDGYYPSDAVNPEEKYIMPTLFDNVKKSYDALLDSSIYYKTGKKVLIIPGLIRETLRKFKRHEKKD